MYLQRQQKILASLIIDYGLCERSINQLRVYILWEEGASKGNHEEQEAANSQNLTRIYFSFSFHFPPLSKRRVADSKPERGHAELVAI